MKNRSFVVKPSQKEVFSILHSSPSAFQGECATSPFSEDWEWEERGITTPNVKVFKISASNISGRNVHGFTVHHCTHNKQGWNFETEQVHLDLKLGFHVEPGKKAIIFRSNTILEHDHILLSSNNINYYPKITATTDCGASLRTDMKH